MHSRIVTFGLLALSIQPAGAEVQILRGTVPAAPPPVERAAPAPGPQMIAGTTLWLLDRGRGELVACRQFKTTSVNGWQIRCGSSQLDRGLLP